MALPELAALGVRHCVMSEDILRRHRTGAVANISTYVNECYSLDSAAIAREYRSRVASAPTRSQPYIVDHDLSGRSVDSSRTEELVAHRMYVERTILDTSGWPPIRIVDFQTPLNSKLSDGLGKVDLLGAGKGLCIIEFKVLRRDGSTDTPLNALLEGVGYCAVVEANEDRITSEVLDKGHSIRSGPLAVFVLAPDDYWLRWDRTRAAQPWRAALRHAAEVLSRATAVRIGFGAFAMSDVGRHLEVTDPLV